MAIGTRVTDIYERELTDRILVAAIEVHRNLGPGLLESVYEACLGRELEIRKINFVRQVSLPIEYKGLSLQNGYRADLIIENKVIIELKCVDKILAVHEAQLLSYLKLSGLRVGLLLNFHCQLLKEGIKRLVL